MTTVATLPTTPLLLSTNPQALCEVYERGPNWLFIRTPRGRLIGREYQTVSLSSELWQLAERHFTYRLVLHLHEVEGIDATAVSELIRLQSMLESYEGSLRLCGLKADCGRQTIIDLHCDSLHNYANQHDAVLGYPCQDQPTCFETQIRKTTRRQQSVWPTTRRKVRPR